MYKKVSFCYYGVYSLFSRLNIKYISKVALEVLEGKYWVLWYRVFGRLNFEVMEGFYAEVDVLIKI